MRNRRRGWARAVSMGLGAGLVFLLAGDRASTQAPPNAGIDPLEILNLQVKNNVLFIIDTSGSMKWPVDIDNFSVGADDPASRMFQAKQAVETVVSSNVGKLNFGLATYNILGSDKTINQTQSFDGDGRADGPFIYVSQDAAADPFYLSQFCPTAAATRDGFFCGISSTFANYDGTNSDDVYRSFNNRSGTSTTGSGLFDDPYPAGCTPGTNCRYYMQSRLFRDSVRYTWDLTSVLDATRLVATTAGIACPLPPVGLTGENPDNNGDGLSDNPRACIEFVDNATGLTARFFYTSAIYQNQAGNTCGGAAVLNAVSDCVGDNAPAILDAMEPELPVIDQTTLTGPLTANTITNYMDGDNTPVKGLRADQSTPLAASLKFVRTTGTPAFPPVPGPVVGIQKNFVILLTDGDDTCAGGTNDQNAVDTAKEAELLFANTASPRNQAETLVIAFAASVNIERSNAIAKGGSGGNVDTSQPPATAVTCPAGVPCRNAFSAQNTTELINALNAAIELIVSSGEFSASQSIVGTVFELIVDDPATPAVDEGEPLDPKVRYNQRVNLLFLPTFELPNWEAHLYAFRNDGTFQPVAPTVNPNQDWDAGDALFFQVAVQGLQQGSGAAGANRFTFDELHAGATVAGIRASSAPIKRRIFTSAGSGTFPRASAQFDSASSSGRNVVALWPPNQAGLSSGIAPIDPSSGTVGPLDNALGIGPTSTKVLTFADLKSSFGACDGSVDASSGPIPAACAAQDLNEARKEARQIILAFTAGAKLVRSTVDNKPFRDGSSQLLFRDRGWLLRDSTLAVPAIVTPPLKFTPQQHAKEWVLFRDGRRNTNREGIDEIDQGFGLRNPDFDNANPTSDLSLKPRMTVVYVGSNDMLHAISAETAEELWGFVPFDQLGKLKDFISPGQARNPHIYMVAASVRVSDIFVPGTFTLGGITFDGRWRTVIFFGRGPGGKHYTALDVTAPGPFTDAALDTNPPWVMWSRGNPDVNLAGSAVRGADTVPYSKMGQTWSTPAIGNIKLVDADNDGTADNLPEWRAFVGSGYGSNVIEGKTFYVLDAITGDVVQSFSLADETAGTSFADSALVANASGFNSFQLDPPGDLTRDPSSDFTSRIYIPDIHGRIWKFNAQSGGMFAKPGPDHPFGNAVALLKIVDDAFVFAESGNDTRVLPPPNFKIFGYRDTDATGFPASSTTPQVLGDPTGAAGFTRELVQGGGPTFRGTSQPGTAFADKNSDGIAETAVVFFLGTRFNPPGVDCVATFDSILFAGAGETGAAVVDFVSGGDLLASASDESVVITGKRMGGIQVVGGQVVLSEGGSLGAAPGPPPAPSGMPTPPPPAPPTIKVESQAHGTAICR